MNNKLYKSIQTTLILLMALLQGPYIYYYADGLFGFIIVIPYALIGLFLTSLLLYCGLKFRQTTNFYHIAGLSIAILLGFFSLSSEELIEKLDWKLRISERNRIIEQVKQGKLAPNLPLNDIMCKLPGNSFPPISVGGNEIAIYKPNSHTIKVEFYINRGFLDHYSAFLYTNDQEQITHMNKEINFGHSQNYKRLTSNWYRVSY